ERFPLEPVFQHMYLAVARTRLGEATAETNEWQRALEAAGTAEKLLALASYAEQNQANDVADRAYSEAIRLAPKNRGAYAGRLRLGRNKDALEVFRKVRVTGTEPPGALAVRAAVLAANGYEEGARGDARNLGREHLLPEERALIAPLLQ